MNTEEITRLEAVKDAIYHLSLSNKAITVQQIREASGVNNPEHEIEVLRKKGIIMQIKGEILWV